MPQAGTILLTGDLPAEELHSLQVSLQALESMKGTKILAAESILCCAATVSQVVEADAIILVADCSYSQYGAVRSQREKIQSLGKTVFGCILYA